MSSACRLIFFLALAAMPLSAFEWRKLPNDAFRTGEMIRFVIKYGEIRAGEASLQVHSLETVGGRRAYHVISQARTNRALDKLFKVRDSNDSWIDVESLCSLQFMQNVREGGYRKWSLTTFDQPAGRFHYVKKGKGGDDRIEGEMPPFTHDVLSSIYYLRTLALQPQTEHTLNANTGGKNWPLKVVVHAVENVDVPAGTFQCFRVEPKLEGEGLFQNKGRVEVWMTTDSRKIPVLMRSKVAVGSFDAEMTEYAPGN
jgi:hypothetical protein